MLADLVDLHDVGVLQSGDRLRLDAEPLPLRGAGISAAQDHFQGDDAVEADLPGLVNDAHAAAVQLLQDLVAGHGQAHRWRRPGAGRRGPVGRKFGAGRIGIGGRRPSRGRPGNGFAGWNGHAGVLGVPSWEIVPKYRIAERQASEIPC